MKGPNSVEIIYEDEEMIAINKPHGLLVHRTKLAADVDVFALQLLRDQINQRVYPVHRLDRKTSGVLLFAKSAEANSKLSRLFQQRNVQKSYMAIIRGFLHGQGEIDHPLEYEGKTQEALTQYLVIRQYEIDVPSGGFQTSRYSLVELRPHSGRFHQLRKHMAHIRHPIIGDRPHGCNKQNRIWKEQFKLSEMFLHAASLSIQVADKERIEIEATFSQAFQQALAVLQNQNLPKVDG